MPMKVKLAVILLVAAGSALGFFLGRFSASSVGAEEFGRLQPVTKHAGRSEVEQASSAELPREDFFSRFYQLQAELLAGGETNIAVKVGELSESWLLSQYTKEARHAVGYLELLRAGDTNLIEWLEIDLDTALSGLKNLHLGEKQLKALQAAKHYRAKFPRLTGRAPTDEAVAEALNLVHDK